MLNRFLFWTITTVILLKAIYSNALSTPVVISPRLTPMVRFMNDKFSAERFIRERKFTGNDVALSFYGKFNLLHNNDENALFSLASIKPLINLLQINLTQSINTWTALVLDFCSSNGQNQEKSASSMALTRYALVFDIASRNRNYSKAKNGVLPFNMYGAIGRFDPLFFKTTSEQLTPPFENLKKLNHTEGAAITVDKEFSTLRCSGSLFIPIDTNSVSKKFVTHGEFTLYQANFDITAGGSYSKGVIVKQRKENPCVDYYSLFVLLKKGIFQFKGETYMKSNFDSIRQITLSNLYDQCIEYYIEGIAKLDIFWPITIVGGYSYLNGWMATMKIKCSPHIRIGIGAQIPQETFLSNNKLKDASWQLQLEWTSMNRLKVM